MDIRQKSRRLAQTLTTEGNVVDVRDARRIEREVMPEAYDGVIVAASIHARGYQRAVRRWVRRHAAALNGLPTAFLSVCLAVLEHRPEVEGDLRRILERFVARTGWHPTISQHIAGALLYTRYGWLKKRIMRRIVAKASADTDTSRDYEYTDWKALEEFAHSFADRVDAAAHALPQVGSR